MIEISTILGERRNQLGFSQTYVAAEAGMRQSEISDLETGKETNPKLQRLARLASTLRLRLVLVPDDCADLHKGCSECGAPTEGPADFCPDHTPDAT